MRPSFAQLQAAVARIAQDYKSQRWGVIDVTLTAIDGAPVVILHGTGPAPMPGLPKAFRMALPAPKGGQPGAYVLPIQWRYAAHPANRQMWSGGTPVTNLFPRLIEVGGPPDAPQNPDPVVVPPVPEEYQYAVSARRPGFVAPNFWGKPFEVQGTVCLGFYQTWYQSLVYTVQQTEMVVITSASYEFNNSIQLLDQFQVQVQETGLGKSAMWTDMYISADPDPAKQFAFAGHCQPIYLRMIVDHDQTVMAKIKVLGPTPFTTTPSTKLGGCGTVFLHGFISKLVEVQDIGARPSDTGAQDGNTLGSGGEITPGGAWSGEPL